MSASWEIREGDALERLREMPDESVQCAVTSPPYFGLRDYQSKPSAWPLVEYALPGGTVAVAATDCALGLEPTPEAFVGHLVLVFREVRRALRSDGTLWLNIGDSYAGSWGAQSRGGAPSAASTLRGNGHVGGGPKLKSLSAVQIDAHPKGQARTGSVPAGADYKAKDLLGIPWLLAFALRTDGWYLRRDVIWGKPNPMPESVTDRPTSAHEYVFLLAKSPRYFYDADAIREEGTGRTTSGILGDRDGNHQPNGRSAFATAIPWENPAGGRNKRDVWTVPEGLWSQFLRWLDEQQAELPDVWRVATQPFPGSHFATFPPKLIEPCILAGSAVGDVILDPFAGAGTTGLVALRHDRSFIGIELNPSYAEMARERIRQDAPLLNTPAEAVA